MALIFHKSTLKIQRVPFWGNGQDIMQTKVFVDPTLFQNHISKEMSINLVIDGGGIFLTVEC